MTDVLKKEEILKTLERNSKKIRESGVKKLTLFGLYARDEQGRNSDIDLLVEFKEGRGLFETIQNYSIS